MSSQVPQGYKQTEVGVIPKDWDVMMAMEACDLVVDCKNRTPPLVEASDYAVVRTSNVRNGQFVLEDLRFTDEASYHEWTARAVPQFGDIMITREAPLGEVCSVPDDRKVCLGQRMMLYRPSPSKTNSLYFLYALMSFSVRENLLRKVGGSTVEHAKVDDIRFLQLPAPSLLEQQAIASTLSDIDNLLASLDRLIAKKRDLKQATMQQLLTGKKRLPGFDEDWQEFCLKDMADIVSGGTPKTTEPSYWNGNIQWCTPTDITGCSDKYLMETERCISINGLQNSGTRLLPKGSLLLCSRATVGEIKIAGCEICTNQGFKSLVCYPNMHNEFLYYKLLIMKQAMIERAFGSTFLEISKTNVAALEVFIPTDIKEQTAIAQVLTDMDTELTTLQTRRAKTQALKQAMMQELLTGRTRLI